MYTYLMDTFDMIAPINYLDSMSFVNSITIVVDKTHPWVLPLQECPQVPLSVVEVSYQDVFNATSASIMNPSSVSQESDESYLPTWEDNST